MLHILLHFAVPLLVALTFYRSRWLKVYLILITTMLVDLDHLLADPIYDPDRCSIGFHPLHTLPAMIIYAGMFILPFIPGQKTGSGEKNPGVDTLHLIGLGLLIHMALDGIDCLF